MVDAWLRGSRHGGSVAAHCSKAAMLASARPPCRHLLELPLFSKLAVQLFTLN